MVPKVGDLIYVNSEIHQHHRLDDFYGGLAEVIKVDEDSETFHWIKVKERPNYSYTWETFLEPQQEQLKIKFGTRRAHISVKRGVGRRVLGIAMIIFGATYCIFGVILIIGILQSMVGILSVIPGIFILWLGLKFAKNEEIR